MPIEALPLHQRPDGAWEITEVTARGTVITTRGRTAEECTARHKDILGDFSSTRPLLWNRK